VRGHFGAAEDGVGVGVDCPVLADEPVEMPVGDAVDELSEGDVEPGR